MFQRRHPSPPAPSSGTPRQRSRPFKCRYNAAVALWRLRGALEEGRVFAGGVVISRKSGWGACADRPPQLASRNTLRAPVARRPRQQAIDQGCGWPIFRNAPVVIKPKRAAARRTKVDGSGAGVARKPRRCVFGAEGSKAPTISSKSLCRLRKWPSRLARR